MKVIWYLVLVFQSGHNVPVGTVAIPQYNQAICITQKNNELRKPEIKQAHCVKGSMPE